MPNPDETVKTSTRLWSEEVAIAEAGAPVPTEPVVYEFAGGKRGFKDKVNPYA